jgi:hypothetical protein
MKRCVPTLLWIALVLTPLPAGAQHLSLAIQDGQVTLDARDVTLQQILAEWTRIGGVEVINADRVAAAPVSLLLRDLSERQALEVLLRGQKGYVLAARKEGTPGVSAFDRLLILATSSISDPPATTFAEDSDSIQEVSTRRVAPADIDSTREDALQRTVARIESETGTFDQPDAGESSAESKRPPMPMLPPPPPPPPDPRNPGGNVAGTARPGTITAPAGPPPGVVYPPVTNPNIDPNLALGAPQR